MDSIYADMSGPEKEVADYLQELDLWWIYECPIFVYDEKDRPRVWTPDFYIPKLGIYVEVSGSKKFNHNYEYRKKIFKKNETPVIFVHFYKDPRKWKKYLVSRIKEIEAKRHEEVMKMTNSLKL